MLVEMTAEFDNTTETKASALPNNKSRKQT
jgi:hypothetical protein